MIVERFFPADHPAAAGHFPGNPVMPGAVLIAETLRAIEAGLGERISPWRLRSAKFLAPVRPGERIAIDFARAVSGPMRGSIRFTVAVDGRAVLKGEAACGAQPAAS